MTDLPDAYDVLAPDGSEVRILLQLAGGSMAHFRLPPGQASQAVTHSTVEEIWYVVEGEGEMWRKHGETERIDTLTPGTCLTIPVGTHFQFRAPGTSAFAAVGVTMPPWPGMDEAVPVEGIWSVTAGAGA
jgi:mannose-6-phosphate isomerase-like protein (cupin superfamily)